MSKIKTGSFTSAAGAAETIALGFKPDYVKIFNSTIAVDGIMMTEWFGADAGDEVAFNTYRANAGGSAVSPLYDATATTTGPISTTSSTPSVSGEALTFSGEEGFTIDADWLTTSDLVWWIAMKSD